MPIKIGPTMVDQFVKTLLGSDLSKDAYHLYNVLKGKGWKFSATDWEFVGIAPDGTGFHITLAQTAPPSLMGAATQNPAKSVNTSRMVAGLYNMVFYSEGHTEPSLPSYMTMTPPKVKVSEALNEVSAATEVSTQEKKLAKIKDQAKKINFGLNYGMGTLKTAKLAEKLEKANVAASPVKLRHATQVGQVVKGTSEGSTYRVIALNPRVKVAVRVTDKKVSFRVETNKPLSEEMEAIKNFFSWNTSNAYGSVHTLRKEGVAPSRVIGAVVYSLGLEFDSILSPADIKEVCVAQ